MYTWGYIKDVSLAKLDLDEMEASEQNRVQIKGKSMLHLWGQGKLEEVQYS